MTQWSQLPRQWHSMVAGNLYAISDGSRPSHFTKIRILEYLYFHRNRSAATFGVGFVPSSLLRSDLEKIGTSSLDIDESLKGLAGYALVENDIYDADQLSVAYRITPAGRYYIRYLEHFSITIECRRGV